MDLDLSSGVATLVVLHGHIASGKSTWVKDCAEKGTIVVNDDSIVEAVHGGNYLLYDTSLKPLYKSTEHHIIQMALSMGRSVVVDRPCLTRDTRARYVQLARSFDVKAVCVSMPAHTAEEHARRRFRHDARGYSLERWTKIARAHFAKAEPVIDSEGFDRVIRVKSSRVYRDGISESYRQLNIDKHNEDPTWGTESKWESRVVELARRYGCKSILDYGCGKGVLVSGLRKRGWSVTGFDPCTKDNTPPKPHGMVTCIDVLEHVEPEYVDAVIDNLHRLSLRVAFVVISCRPALHRLADGSNAHRTIESAPWWQQKLEERGWDVRIDKDHTYEEGQFVAILEQVNWKNRKKH